MPSTGFYLFLQYCDRNEQILRKHVSMPSTGFYLFLQGYTIRDDVEKESVNALNGLLLISSKIKKTGGIYHEGVNALNGLLLISSVKPRNCRHVHIMCQCPQRASTYFFFGDKTCTVDGMDVSMPSTGFYLFLPFRMM